MTGGETDAMLCERARKKGREKEKEKERKREAEREREKERKTKRKRENGSRWLKAQAGLGWLGPMWRSPL